MFSFPQYDVQWWPAKRNGDWENECDLIKTVSGNKLCSSTVIWPAKLHPMSNSHGNEEDLCLYLGKFSHAATVLVWSDTNIPLFHKIGGKNRSGKTKTQAKEGQLTESKRWMVSLGEKNPLLSRWRLVSFITQSIPRDKAHWIGWGLNRVVQLWDNLGHERISWELHSTSELQENVRQ